MVYSLKRIKKMLNWGSGDYIWNCLKEAQTTANKGNGVWSGCATSEKGAGANMSVDVAVGVAFSGDTERTVGATNIVIEAAHADNNRYDLIYVPNTGAVPTVLKGTGATPGTEKPPEFNNDEDCLLAVVFVEHGVTEIYDADIKDCQIVIQNVATAKYTDERFPSGLITMWHGTIANIPSGHVICDGNNSTPNLLDKFVKSVTTAAENPGSTGGATTHRHGSGDTGGNFETTLTSPKYTNYADHTPPYYELAYLMKT